MSNLCGGALSGRPGGVFLEEKLGSLSWGVFFLRKSLGCQAGARISREKAWYAKLGRVFLKKKLGMLSCGAYFSRKNMSCMAGARISRENARGAWLVRVFFEKKLGLLSWGAYFSSIALFGYPKITTKCPSNFHTLLD